METEVLPKSYLSEAEREETLRKAGPELLYLKESSAAGRAGDHDASWSWLAKAEMPAHSLMFLKKRRGAQFIRKYGFRTVEAEAVYGAGWLDQ